MGYAPKHAKPAPLKGATVHSAPVHKGARGENCNGAFGMKEGRGGRHRTGVATATRVPEGILASLVFDEEGETAASAERIHNLMTFIPLQRQPHPRS